jgi:predicted methyltransferase
MGKLKLMAAAWLLAAAPAALAAPADFAAGVQSPGRPADAIELDASRKPAEILSYLGLEKGQRALDLFTGSGYYAEIMGKAVGPEGTVVAWEPANFHDGESQKKWTALQARVPNARLLVSDATAIDLPTDSFDFVLMHMIYHDLYWESAKYKFPRLDPDAVLKKVYAATKPGGVVGVVDHVAAAGGDTRAVVEKLHRIDPKVIRADFERAGFVFEGESDLLRNASDDHSKLVFDPSVRGKTDRVVYRFRKPAA